MDETAEREPFELYAATNAGGSGTGDGDETSGDAAEQPTRRRRRVRIDTADSAATEQPTRRRRRSSASGYTASKSEITALAYPIAMSFQLAFRVPAQVRTRQWPLIHGQPAGAFWLLSDTEAMDLAEAWARVALLYLPPDQLSKGSAISAALIATFSIVGDRVYQDAQIAQSFKARSAPPPLATEETNGYSGFTE